VEFLVIEETVGYGACLKTDSYKLWYLELIPLTHHIGRGGRCAGGPCGVRRSTEPVPSVGGRGACRVTRTMIQGVAITLDGIDLAAFTGGASVQVLFTERYRGVPQGCGVYVLLREGPAPPRFSGRSKAGWFKGLDPSYPAEVVTNAWVPNAKIVYVGKAAGKKGLRERVRQLIDFGFGKAVSHRGGRLLWHLEDHRELKLLWMECPREFADDLETQLIARF
jgi:hypothetical protein